MSEITRVAAIYDIHGNLPALEAVLAEIDRLGVDLILVGGDVVSGPMPVESLERLEARGDHVRFIRGNGDRATAAAAPPAGRDAWAERDRWVVGRLSAAQRERVGAWPETARVTIDGLGPTLFCHATPRSDEEIVTRITPVERLAEVLAGVAEATVVCGHTHVQFDRTLAGRRLVNAGSVGMPYEGRPGAYWTLLGPGVEPRRTPYDVEAAAAAIRATGFPAADEFARRFVLEPFGPEEVTARFERMAVEQASRPS